MNTVKSVWYGWGALVVACGGAYYFAKKSINEDRRERYMKQQAQRRYQEALEASYSNDPVNSPSSELQDPAPTRHAPETEKQRIEEKSKYEASVPYKSPRGDRFS